LARTPFIFVSRESPQGLGADITGGTNGQSKRGHGRIVGCIEYRNDVVASQRPEEVLRVTPNFLARSLTASARLVLSLTLRMP
jgi:hypothetical protein